MNGFLLSSNAWASAWGEVMWRAAWQGGLLLVGVWLSVLLFPRIPAGARSWLWRIACLKLLLGCVSMPSIVLPLSPPAWASADSPVGMDAAPLHSLVPGLLSSVPASASDEGDGRSAPLRNRPARSMPSPKPLSLPSALLCLWLLGVSRMLGAALQGGRRTRILRSRCIPVTAETPLHLLAQVGTQFQLRRLPDLYVGDVPTPLLIGIRRPTILLPTAVAEEATEAQLGWILAHEAAHMQRKDMLWGWISLLARSLFFFHPIVWLTWREWTLAQESACDASVVQIMQAPRAEYGQMLVTLATTHRSLVSENAATLGVLQSYKALERRLMMLKHSHDYTPRQLRLTSLLVGLTAVLCLTPWKVTAQSDIPADKNVRLAQRWEDVLLLDAIDYLRLSPQQALEMHSLAQYAHGRMAGWEQEQEKTRARLEYLVQRQREALVQGQSPSASEQAEALELEQSLRARQEPVGEEITRYVTPRLARLLTRKQMQRVWLLALGETPQGERSHTALLDPGSGFVLDEHTKFVWNQDQVSYALHQIYSDAVIEAAHRPGGTTAIFAGLLGHKQDEADTPDLPQLSDEMREAVSRDEDAIRSRIGDTPDLYLDQAKPEQWEVVLRPLVRRLFLSKRLEPALTERLHKKS